MARNTDPKKRHVGDRHRLLTIHDGTRLTPAIVAVLEALSNEAVELGASEPEYRRDYFRPVLVARADGLALYVENRRIG